MRESSGICLFVFLLLSSGMSWGSGSAATSGTGETSSILNLSIRAVLQPDELEWRLGECILGFSDLRDRLKFGHLIVGRWITEEGDGTWLFRISTSKDEVKLAALRVLQTAKPRREAGARLDCNELQAEKGKLFEAFFVPPEKAAKLGEELAEALAAVQVPIVQDFKLHADSVLLLAYSAGGLQVVLFRIAPPSPALSGWLYRFREVIIKEGVKQFGENSGAMDTKP
ncbi:MAG: hypothetical protein KatS3mg007_1449 [Thermoanaerobaculum sp.]|nr:MAG: hypothetical protein KatS3mg007_1449 [Thermoanaerobaculum sp.]